MSRNINDLRKRLLEEAEKKKKNQGAVTTTAQPPSGDLSNLMSGKNTTSNTSSAASSVDAARNGLDALKRRATEHTQSAPVVNQRRTERVASLISDSEYNDYISRMRSAAETPPSQHGDSLNSVFSRRSAAPTDRTTVERDMVNLYENLRGVNKTWLKNADTYEDVPMERRERTDAEIAELADSIEAKGYVNEANEIRNNPEAYRFYDAAPATRVSMNRQALEERDKYYATRAQKHRENLAWEMEGDKWEAVADEAAAAGWQFTDEDYANYQQRINDEIVDATYHQAMTNPNGYAYNTAIVDDKRQAYTLEEASTYEYLRSQGRNIEAEEYARYLSPTVSQRMNAEAAASMQEMPLWAQALMHVATNPYKAVNWADVNMQRLGNWITGSDMPIDVHTSNYFGSISNAAREGVVNGLNEPGNLGDLFNYVFNTDYTFENAPAPIRAMMNMGLGDVAGMGLDSVNSVVNRIYFGNANGAAMMMQSGSDAYVEASERGATNRQLGLYGDLVGAAEGIGERISFNFLKSGWDKISGGKTGWKFAAAVGMMALTELAEGGAQEAGTEVMALLADDLVMRELSEYNVRVRELTAEGYSVEDAQEIARNEAEDRIFTAAISGGFSQVGSFVGGAPANVSRDNRETGRNIKNLGNAEALQQMFSEASGTDVQMPKTNAGVGREFKRQMAALQKANDAERDAAVLDWYDRMKGTYNEGATEQDVKAARKSTPELDAVRKALLRSAQGRKVNGKQQQLLAVDDAARATIEAYNRGDIKMSDAAIKRAETMDYAQAATVVPDIKTVRDTIETGGTTEAVKQQASEVGAKMTRVEGAGSSVNGEGIQSIDGIKQVANGDQEAVVTVTMADGSKRDVNIDEVSFGNDTNTEVIEYASVMKTPELASQFIEASKTATIGLDRLANGMNHAYDMGFAGFRNLSTVQKSNLTQRLDASVVKAAYEMGVAARANTVDGRIDKAAQRVAKHLGREWRPGNVNKTRIAGVKLSAIQQENIKQVEMIAKLMGINVELFESKANSKGNFVGENGSYNSRTNTIALDINAGRNEAGEHSMYQTAMLRTMSHELTHAIQRNTPKAYEALKNAVLDVLESQDGYSLEDRVDKRLADAAAAAKKSGKQPSITTREQAVDEVIADACEMMLRDSDAVKKLAEAHPDVAKSFGQKVIDFIDRLLKAIRDIFGSEYSKESKTLAQAMESDLQRIRDMWSNALVEVSEMSGRELADEGVTTVEAAMAEAMDGAKDENGNDLFSMRTMEEDKDIYREMLLKHGDMTEVEIDRLFLTIDALMNRIEQDRLILDFGENIDSDNRSFKPVKPNSDPLYQVSIDFSTLCRKRLLQQACQERLEAELGRAVTKAERVAIREQLITLQEHGKQIEVACALCYVESARLKSPAQIQRFMDNRQEIVRNYFARRNPETRKLMEQAEAEYRATNNIGDKSLKELGGAIAKKVRAAKNAPIADYVMSEAEQKTADKAMSMTVSEFTTSESLWKLKADDPVLFDIYASYIRNATKSKGIEGDTPWKAGDSKTITDELIEKMNEENGLRSQSWSDFQTYHILDYIGAVIELSTRKAKMQSYTKVPAYVRLMGETGMMINMSLIPEAKFDGTLRYDNVEGFIHAEALALRDEYPNTAGTICIGISDDHIRLLLADGNIDYVIPYHKSGMDAATRRKMRIPSWQDYEKQQSEKPLRDGAGKPPKFSEWYNYDKAVAIAEYANNTAEGKAAIAAGDVMYGARIAMQDAAQRYLDICAERGLAPKFQKFTGEANYWKLLIDRKMINNKTGAIIKQNAVKPIFNQDNLIEICDNEVSNFKRNNADFNEAVDAVVEAQRNGTLGKIAGSKKVQQIVRSHEDWVTVQAAVGVNDVQHSDRVTEEDVEKMSPEQLNDSYMEAYKRGDEDTMRRTLDAYAARKGYNSGHLYHGTRHFGFTEFRLDKAAFGTSIFTTSSLRVAESYTPWGSVRKLTDKVADNFTDMSTEQLIDIYTKYTGTKLYPVTPKNKDECYDLVRKGLDRIINNPEAISKRDELIASNPNLKRHISRLEAMVKRFAAKNKMLSSFMVTYRQNQLGKVANQIEALGGAEYLAIIEQPVAGRIIEMRALLTGEEVFFSRYGDNITLYNHASIAEYLSVIYPNQKMGVYDLYAKMSGLFMVDVEGRKWFDIDGAYIDRPGETVKTDDVCAYAAQNGFKGVCFRNINDPGTQRNVFEIADSVVAIFDPKAVKSADLVTLDNNGKVIPLSKRFDDAESDIRYSERDPDAITDREILANILDTPDLTAEERNALNAYKDGIKKLDGLRADLKEQQAIVRELAGLRETDSLTSEQQDEYTKAKNRASILDKQISDIDANLTTLQGKKSMLGIVSGARQYLEGLQEKQSRWSDAETKLANQMHEGARYARLERLMGERIAAKDKAIADIRTSHENAATVAKIRNKAKALDKVLRGADKNTFVPDELRTPLAEVLKMLTYTREGENSKWNISTERNTVFGDAYGKDGLQRFERLRAAYDAIIKQDGEFAKAADPVIGEMLQKLSYAIDGKDIKALDSEGLDMVNYVLNSFKRMISEGNKLHRAVRSFTIEQATAEFIRETEGKAYLHSKFNQSGFVKMVRDGQLTPPYFFRRLGGIFGELGNDLLKGESTYGVLYGQYTKQVQDILKKYNHKKWADKKGDTLTVTTKAGTEVTLTREQALSIYATHERQRRDNIHKARHLQGGGIELKIDDADLPMFKGIKKDSKSVPLEASDIRQITNWLTDEQISFANEMVGLMSGDLAKLGNQTSRILYGNSKFGEEFYFPYVVNKQFFDLNAGEAGDAMIKNMGFTHSLQDDSTARIVISNFTDVVTQHINSMLIYHSFAIPQDNIVRLLNHRISENETVNGLFEAAYGMHMSEYLKQLMRDIYGGIGTKDPANEIVGGIIGRARKNSVMWSKSVAIQQPSSIARAFAYIRPKYFVGKPTKKAYEELLKYSGTANIKAVGGFDMGNTRNFAEAMRSERLADGVLDAWDKMGSWLPGQMDVLTWTAIWEAVKREQAAKTGLAKTDEKLLKIAGDRFDEVIRLTQVYDSTLSRSQNMRSDTAWMKTLTAFFGEPTVTSNMVMDAFSSDAGKGMRGRVLAYVGVNILLNSLLKSFVGAARDDDDEEATYWERYFKYAIGDVINNINPINYIPFAKDVWSEMLGYTSGRPDLAITKNFVDLVDVVLKDDKSGWDIAEAAVKFLSGMSGTGVSNIWRDTEAVFNTYNASDNKPRDGWLINALKEGAIDTVPFIDKILPSPAEKLFLLAVDGDNAGVRKQRKYMRDYKGKDDKEINTALTTEVKKSYADGDISEKTAIKLLEDYCGMSETDAYWRVQNWETGESGEYARFDSALSKGTPPEKVIVELYEHDDGEPSERRSNIDSRITAYYKPLYINASPAERREIANDALDAYEANWNVYRRYDKKATPFDREYKRGRTIDKWLD